MKKKAKVKKAKVTVKRAKVRHVKHLGGGKTQVIADAVEFEVHGPIPPSDPLPDEIVFDDHIAPEKHTGWAAFFKSFW